MTNIIDVAVSENRKPDEIDLLELLRLIWRKKWWVVLSTIIFTVVAAVYAFTAKEEWTSSALVKQPQVSELGNYLSLQNEYANIIQNQAFSAEKLSTELFDQFSTLLFSNDIKRQFFEQSEWYIQSISDKDSVAKQRFLADLLQRYLQVARPDLKKNPNAIGITISFAAELPSDAQYVLTAYIEFVNKKVLVAQQQDFISRLEQQVNTLNFQKDQLEQKTKITRQEQLNNLANALSIAKNADIVDYFNGTLASNQGSLEILLGKDDSKFKLNDNSYLFMQGEKYLQAQLDTLKDAELIYPIEYYTTKNQLSLLIPLIEKAEQGITASSYHYLASPDYPVTKDKPKRALIMLIGLILGVLFS
ncbi:chain-length determining protein, partial [Testudinibacter sp. TR-2022]